MQAHDWTPTVINAVIALLMALGGIAFHSTVRSLISDSNAQLASLKSKYEAAIREAEDNVLAFIRKHEQDPYAHPNSVALQEIKTEVQRGMSSLRREIRILREAFISAGMVPKDHLDSVQVGPEEE